MVTIVPALREIRKDLAKYFDRKTVRRICAELEYGWRNRKLDPYTTLHLFILQILNRNTGMTHLPHLSGERFSASAYCQARQRLPLELFEKLVNSFSRGLKQSSEAGRWKGHQVLLIDGSSFSMPDTPELQDYFGLPGGQKPGCGFPVAHLLVMVDAQTGYLYDIVISAMRTHDMSRVADLHPGLSPGDVVVADRGFCSYSHLALVYQRKLHAVFRMHQRQIVSFHPHRPSADQCSKPGAPRSRWIRRLGQCDQIVQWQKPNQRPDWMSTQQFASLPRTLLVRELKYRIRTPSRRVQEVILVTTLLDAELYPAAEIAKLYELRWQVEVDLRDLKITLGLDVLKSKKVETIHKEVLMYVLVYNLVRSVAVTAGQRQRVSSGRISFIDALRWLTPPKPCQPLPTLVVNHPRPNRGEPRCRKRRPKKYPLMTKPRETLRKRLRKRLDAA